MLKIFSVLIIIISIFYKNSVLAGPTHILNAGERSPEQENVHLTLLSIEDKLRNLENILNVQCTTIINGKIDYYGRKIDNIERDLSRFQIYTRMELDKISENISSKNFKDDITKDRIIRKIDVAYERINHKLDNIEGQIELTAVKSQNGRELVITKLEKMEESLTIRDADMEAELADAVAAIDDLKTTCTSIEENLMNATNESTKVLSKNNEKYIKKYHSQTMNFLENTNRSLLEGVLNLQNNMTPLLNETYKNALSLIQQTKDEFDDDLNEYANKMIDMYSELGKKFDVLDNTLQSLAKVSNLTRNEQQNGLRALMVQVGRKTGKQEIQGDSSIDSSKKLQELSEKIDANFENVMLAQNLFLESCHRVQMDEAQLESQISIILEKLIDIFENKTSVGPKDIEQLTHLIKTHDSNIRKSIYHITNNLLALMEKTTSGNSEIIDYINNQRSQLEIIFTLLQDIPNLDVNSEQIQSILASIYNFQQQLNQTNHQTHSKLARIDTTNNLIAKMLNSSYNINWEVNSNLKLQQTLEFIKNIYHILTSIEMKINKSYLDYFLNKYNIEAVAHRFGKRLNSYFQNTKKNESNSEKIQKVPELLMEIFGEPPNNNESFDPYDDHFYAIGLNSTRQDDQIENDNKKTLEKCLPNYLDLIDVRSNYDTLNCSDNMNTTEESTEKSTNNNLPNYIDLIDVRSNNEDDNNNNNTSPSSQVDFIEEETTQPYDNNEDLEATTEKIVTTTDNVYDSTEVSTESQYTD